MIHAWLDTRWDCWQNTLVIHNYHHSIFLKLTVVVGIRKNVFSLNRLIFNISVIPRDKTSYSGYNSLPQNKQYGLIQIFFRIMSICMMYWIHIELFDLKTKWEAFWSFPKEHAHLPSYLLLPQRTGYCWIIHGNVIFLPKLRKKYLSNHTKFLSTTNLTHTAYNKEHNKTSFFMNNVGTFHYQKWLLVMTAKIATKYLWYPYFLHPK